MITTYLRSSSYNTFDFCQMKCYLDYCLGYNSPANKSAQKGTIVHKALEILAQHKLAQQESRDTFYNQELSEHFNVNSCTPDVAIELAYWHYVNKREFEYIDKDFIDCKEWLHNVLTWKDGMFSPLNLTVVAAEKFFDFEITEPWAKYSYTLEDKSKLEGYMALKGTLDLIISRGDNVLEIVDWKTGRRYNWNTFKVKEYDDFYNDPQMLMYYYAARKLYPLAEQIFFTVFWAKDGGPYSICFQDDDVKRAELMLKKRFNQMRHCQKPKRIYPNKKCGWCYFSNHALDGSTCEYGDSICNQVHKEILELGLDKVTAMRAKDHSYNKYAEGGGRTHDG